MLLFLEIGQYVVLEVFKIFTLAKKIEIDSFGLKVHKILSKGKGVLFSLKT